MSAKNITEANREAWDQVAPIHGKHNQETLMASFRNPDFSVLNDIETTRLNAIGVEGKNVTQICCNNGRELISVKRMGAARCVGFDGAQGFVEQARQLNETAGTDCEFVCTNVYEIDPAYHASFDIVTITIGVLTWMPDLPAFFNVLSQLMRPGAALFLYEQHPLLEMMEVGGPDDPAGFELSYFTKEPYVDESGLDYFGGENYAAKPATSFSHTLSDIMMAGIGTGLVVEHFEEFPDHISNTWYNVETQIDGFPMSYTLVLRKTGE